MSEAVSGFVLGKYVTISSSGLTNSLSLLLEAIILENSRAARLVFVRMAPSPASGRSGMHFSVNHSAAAAAPGREHSRLISPRCKSFEVK